MRWIKGTLIGFIVLAVLGVTGAVLEGRAVAADWRTASHEPMGFAPDPAQHPEPIVQIYAARAWGWRGYFGVHTWIASKRQDADSFVVYEVIGWRKYRGLSVVAVSEKEPDRRWFGAPPRLLLDIRGEDVEAVIDDIERAVLSYPHANDYTVWPGPNSNTFVAYVARRVPGLHLDLPPTAIGKDYLSDGLVAESPSGTGYQFSVAGLLGVMAAREEGLEVNLFGLTFGVDPLDLAVKLPGLGRLSALSDG